MATRLNAPDLKGALHFVTLCARDRKKVFRRDPHVRGCLERLRSEADRQPGELLAFVVMPEHLHFLLWTHDGELARFLTNRS